MSSTWPREQARTNRVATTGLLSNLPRSSAVRRTMRREREPACPVKPGLDSCTTNHSGNRHAPIPRCRSCQCSGSDGGVYSRGSCTPVMEVSLEAKRGSSIGSRLVSEPQVSSPPTMADSFGRSNQGSRPERGDDLGCAAVGRAPFRSLAGPAESAGEVLQEQVYLRLDVAQ